MNLTEYPDTVIRLKTQLDEGLGHCDDVPLILGVCPLHPDPVPLDSQCCLVRNPGHCLLDHPPERLWGNVGDLTPLSLADCVIESDLDRNIGSRGSKLNIVKPSHDITIKVNKSHLFSWKDLFWT